MHKIKKALDALVFFIEALIFILVEIVMYIDYGCKLLKYRHIVNIHLSTQKYTIDPDISFTILEHEINEWCMENAISKMTFYFFRYSLCNLFHHMIKHPSDKFNNMMIGFTNESDAVAFKLRWL
jgi:hypothetical protein